MPDPEDASDQGFHAARDFALMALGAHLTDEPLDPDTPAARLIRGEDPWPDGLPFDPNDGEHAWVLG